MTVAEPTDNGMISAKRPALILKPHHEPSNLMEIFCETRKNIFRCASCGGKKKEDDEFVELEPYLISFRYGDIFPPSVPLADQEKAYDCFRKYLKSDLGGVVNFFIKKVIFLRLVHEPTCELKDTDVDYEICENEIYLSKYVKIGISGNALRAFLKIDPETVAKFSEMDTACLDRLRKMVQQKYSDSKDLRMCVKTIEKYKKKIGRTKKFKNHKLPPGFGLTLRDYQQANLSWMCAMESPKETKTNTIFNVFGSTNQSSENCIKFCITGVPYDFEFNKSKLSVSPAIECPPIKCVIRLKGGNLLDMPGSGKKVTALALIHAKPASKSKQPQPREGNVIESPATLVMCSDNNYCQWIEEAKRCNPNFKIVAFLDLAAKETKEHPNQLRTRVAEVPVFTKAFVDADIIVVTYSAYAEHQENELKNVHFHRVIFEDYKCKASRKIENDTKSIKADHIWVLGPGPAKLEHFLQAESLAGLYGNEDTRLEFTRKYFKKTKFERPLISDESCMIYTKFTSREYEKISKAERKSPKHQVLRCGFTVNPMKDRSPQSLLTRPDPIDRIEAKLIDRVKRKLSSGNYFLNLSRVDYEKALAKSSSLDSSTKTSATQKAKLKRRKNKMDKLEAKVRSLERELSFKANMMEGFKTDPSSMECSICRESTYKKRPTILNCGHYFCYDCIYEWIAENEYCPCCNANGTIKDFKCVISNNDEEQVSRNDCGSKFVRMYSCIEEIFEANPNARIVIYVQFKPAATMMGLLLKRTKFEFAHLTGSPHNRYEAIQRFHTSPTCRILLACYNDNIRGVHLPEATHLIYYSPFFVNKVDDVNKDNKNFERNVVAEKRGRRMFNNYSLNRSVKITHFFVTKSRGSKLCL